jgi:hypothetical protein
LKPVTQTLFGAPDGPPELIGNCFPACMASLLELELDQVPHVYQLHPETEPAWEATLAWLRHHGHTIFCFEWGPWVHRSLLGALVLVSGQSPRGPYQHVVIGEVTADGWRLVHDPHPDGGGITGDPTMVEIIFELKRGAP